jgi:hypothetical protein
MNSTTYRDLEEAGIIDSMKARGEHIYIDESIPDGVIRRTEDIDIAELKRREAARYEGLGKTRTGYTKPGIQRRDVTKAKAARAARKRNRK